LFCVIDNEISVTAYSCLRSCNVMIEIRVKKKSLVRISSQMILLKSVEVLNSQYR